MKGDPILFRETELPSAYIIEPQRFEDERGFFARTWCRKEFSSHGLNPKIAQISLSYSPLKGTLRGMHYQAKPHQEAKLIRCTRGAIFDVIIDLRKTSPTYLKHIAVELNSENRLMLYAPEGFAHGFLTLQDGTEVLYQMSEFYHPESQRGVRWDDPAFQIRWPFRPTVISERDATYPDYEPTGPEV